MKKIFFFIVYSICQIYSQSEDLRLSLVYILARNGVDQPMRAIEKNNRDIYNEYWNYPGEETEVGLRMNYLLGRRNYQLYREFTSKEYLPNEWVIKSADYNKTISSAHAHMIGYFSNFGDSQMDETQIQNSKISMVSNYENDEAYKNFSQEKFSILGSVPIFPVSLFPRTEKGYFFLYGYVSCKPILEVFDNNKKNEAFLAFSQKFKEDFGDKLVSIYQWANNTVLDSIENIFTLCDTFLSDYTYGKVLYQLTSNNIDLVAFNQSCTDFHKIFLYDYYNGGEENLLPKLTSSIFLKELIEWIENRIQADYTSGQGKNYYKSTKTPKIISQIIPDIPISSLLKYFNMTLETQIYDISFASSLNIELYTNDKAFKINDNNDNMNEIYKNYYLSINFNDNYIVKNMQYDEFKSKISEKLMTYDEVIYYCYGLTPVEAVVEFAYKNATIILGVLTGIFFSGFLVTICCCCCCCVPINRKDKKEKKEDKAETQNHMPVMNTETDRVKTETNRVEEYPVMDNKLKV